MFTAPKNDIVAMLSCDAARDPEAEIFWVMSLPSTACFPNAKKIVKPQDNITLLLLCDSNRGHDNSLFLR
jgi:hypothetical protein